ncbi:hypothetical protein [Arthrobacter sp. HS15c]
MGNFGGTQYARDTRQELRRRWIQRVSYIFLGALAAATAGVVILALTR